jgi:glycosyltransferase involved in cell wall biosynthesis
MDQVLKWKPEGRRILPVPREVNTGEGGPCRPLNIVMLAPTAFFSDYGCHVRIYEEARTLQERGHRARIYAYHHGRDLPGLNIVRIPSTPWGHRYAMGSSWQKLLFDALLLARAALTQRQPPDLIHAFLHEGALVGRVLARLWNAPLVFDYQGSLTGEMIDHGFLPAGSPMFRRLQGLEKYINNLPEAIVTSSAHAARLLRDRFECRCPLIHTVPDCVDARRFSRPDRAQTLRLRQALGLPLSGRIVGYLGKLATYQGTDLLLQAAAMLHARSPDVHFLIMGYPAVEAYRTKADALGIGQYVHFTGRVPYEQAPQYLALADVAVAPKVSETESNGKLLNYMALGLPTVAFDTPVAHEYLGASGRYAAQSPEGLASALQQSLDDLDAAEEGVQLRERAVTRYTWEQAGERIEQVYRSVLSGAVRSVPAPTAMSGQR